MAKNRRKKTAADTQSVEAESLTTFSIRLNDEQRDLLLKAAALRGWTPTGLVRIATIERAAHIVNTSEQKSIDFKGLAADLARRSFGHRAATSRCSTTRAVHAGPHDRSLRSDARHTQQNATPHPSWTADPSPPPKRIRNRLLTIVRHFMTQ